MARSTYERLATRKAHYCDHGMQAALMQMGITALEISGPRGFVRPQPVSRAAEQPLQTQQFPSQNITGTLPFSGCGGRKFRWLAKFISWSKLSVG